MDNKIKVGLVVRYFSGYLYVKANDLSSIIKCDLKGNLKKKNDYPIIGDYVKYVFENGSFLIVGLEKRVNKLIRPKIANIDQIIIVQSITSPDINIEFVYKFILFYNLQKIYNIIIIISKTDLAKDDYKFQYQSLIDDGFLVLDHNNIDDFKKIMQIIQDKKTIFVGQSGVGKSTLLNKIDQNFSIKTAEISKALNRGKHTTSSTIMYPYKNGYIIDTPGFSSIDFSNYQKDLPKGFKIFSENAIYCKFNDCKHENEPKCKIIELVKMNKISKEMYISYLNFLKQ
ncbi:MAG: ribosome small subunit-dependent GTPase A [Mycoplasmoidaceae bacterium]